MTGIIMTFLVAGIGSLATSVISALIVIFITFRIKQKLNERAGLPENGWGPQKALKFINSSGENESHEIVDMKVKARKLINIFAISTLICFLCFASIGFILLFK